MITASLVKELREKTGAGMMDCKKALTECNGDLDAAVDWLREKGIAKAEKKSSRIAAEGLCNIVLDGNNAWVYELNSETDFVAKNQKFIDILNHIGEIAVACNAESADDVLKASLNGETGEQVVVNATSVIGEKISLRRVVKVTKSDSQTFGVYKHNGGKIAVLSVIEAGNPDLAKDVCMHIAMYAPRFLDETQIDAETLAHEKEMIMAEIANDPKNANKPAEIIEKMSMGRIAKFKKEICLVDQAFVKDPSVTVSQYLSQNKSKAVNYVRFEVGEGMEKRHDDFAAEVAAQAAAAQK